VLEFLRSLRGAERAEWIERLLQRLEVDEEVGASDLMLGWEEVREMSLEGISFGAHTVTHPVLSRVSIDEAREEIAVSKVEIERRLGTAVRAFAYPNGRREDFTERTKLLLREAGYTCAVTTIPGTNQARSNGEPCDLMELRRHGAWGDDRAAFAGRMILNRF
jgi:peptidoglycan/xylan/chitin deacetylase (PgdA/CDA1 family)